MSITFTDEQLKTVSKIVLSTPTEITALGEQKVSVLVGKADALSKDNANKIFYQNYKTIIEAYYDEIKNINGTTYVKYLDSYLEDSAQQKEGNVHYPSSPVWMGFSPKSVNANMGLPTTVNADRETVRLTNIPVAISQLKTGFTDGAQTSTSTAIYTVGNTYIETAITGYVVGKRIVVTDNTRSMLATITGTATTPTARLLITVNVAPSANISSGASIKAFHPGFTNTERETGTTIYPEILSYWRGLIDPEVTALKAFLNSELTALNANIAVGSESTQVNTAKTKVNSAISTITTWQGKPVTGVGTSRYGDTSLSPLSTMVTTRTSESTARATEITTALGSVTQSSDGSYSGTNNWYKFFQWIDFRISKSTGTLFSYYNFDLIIRFIDDKILKANQKKTEYDSYMIVKKIVLAPDGTNVIKVEETTSLSVGNTVKVCDDSDLAITTATISGISGQLITLSVPISGYALDKSARLIRLI